MPPSALAALEPEWAALWALCSRATPFVHPAWLLPWARHHAPGRCGAVALRAGGRLVGFLPVFCWDGALLLAGTGPSDRGEALVAPGFETEAPRLLAALPDAAPEPFDRIDLQQLAADSPLLAAAAPPGWSDAREPGDACLLAPLTGEDGLGAASGRQRSHWRHARRQLERQGGHLGLAASEEVGPAIEDLLRLNALRFGADSVLAEPLLAALLRDAGPSLARAGLLRLHQVTLQGRRIAVLLVLAGPWAHHGYNGGFDPAQSRLSPSALLVGAAMQQAACEGVATFDFLRGGEGYKSVWGAAPTPMHRRLLRPA
ncbi:GNAT family N-acetyltransferase [Rubellimicrobium roseum]|uniref:GNAT family N-acetyltransferase n=1 Tax=Rubellimicrobium roseum TaxID=687525 RepID=A0A5C4N9E0_9RHOB|nr:GNAT family N-acetyltransferase [Rubellimicrobium roseum]TNC70904.1 GNAT family N-acetyltransferase [Rubellimicrobium roseum]